MYSPSEITNIDLLSSYLRTSKEQLKRFTEGNRWVSDKEKMYCIKGDNNIKNIKVLYEKHYIPKKNWRNGHRIVYKLWDQLTTDILKVLKFNLNLIFTPSECVHGFVLNRSVRTNAEKHLGKKLLLNIDIKNYFESIGIIKVKDAFMRIGFNEAISTELSKITTLNDVLVAGFPTSPIIANMVSENFDKDIVSLCNKYNATYTRYADDLSISSDVELPSVDEIGTILKVYGFSINSKKTRNFKRGQNQFVTGLSISDNEYPRIPKAIKRRLRQQLYYLDRFGYHSYVCFMNDWDEETDMSVTSESIRSIRNHIKGWLDYINSIEPVVAKKFYELYNRIETVEIEKRKKEHDKFIEEHGSIITLELFSDKKLPIPKK